MNPIRRARCSVLALSDILLRSTPSTSTLPLSMTSRPERQLSSVVLPQPEGPMMATISPGMIRRLRPRKAFTFTLPVS